MKKIISILLAFIFLFSTTGVTFATHYCGDKAINYKIVFLLNDKHDCVGCEMKKGCCRDEIKNLKIQDDFVSSYFGIQKVEKKLFDFSFLIPHPYFYFQPINLFIKNVSPPFRRFKVDIPILVKSFRI